MKRFTGVARGFAAAMAAAGVLSGIGTIPVMAQYNETEAQEAEAQETEAPEVVKEEKPDGTPFSVAGNGEVLDDITDDETKQFITVRTKNNQTFFVVIDRANKVDNVYMLSMIDENDLAEFLEGEEKEEVVPQVQLPEQTDTMDKGKADDTEIAEEKTSGSNGLLLAAVGFIVLFAAGYYYLKIYKPRQNSGGKRASMEQDTWNADDEDSEYDDDDAEYDDDDAEEYDDSEYEEGEEDDESYEYDEEGDYPKDSESDEDGEHGEDAQGSGYYGGAAAAMETTGDEESYQESLSPGETDRGDYSGADGQDMTEDYYDEDDELEEPEEAKKPARRRRRRRK